MENSQNEQKKPRRRSRRREQRNRFRELPIYKAAKEAIDEFDLVGQSVNLSMLDDVDEPSLTIEQNIKFTRQKPVTHGMELDESAVQMMLAAGHGNGITRDDDGKSIIKFEVTMIEAQLADKFRSRINFATYRQDIPKGANSVTYALVVVRWFYFRTKRGVMRVGAALPLNPAEANLPAGSYKAPPPPNQPHGAKVAFYPTADGAQRAFHPSNGKIVLFDGRYPFDPAKYGVEIPVAFMQEEREQIVAIPFEEVGKELALVTDVKELKLEADEIEWMGKARNVWELLEERSVFEESPLPLLYKARMEFGSEFHPDKDPVLKGMRDKGQKVPEALEVTRRHKFKLLDAAFDKAIKLKKLEEAEEAQIKAIEKAEEEEKESAQS